MSVQHRLITPTPKDSRDHLTLGFDSVQADDTRIAHQRSICNCADSETLETPDSVVTIERTNGWRRLDLRELWAFRELVFLLMWRDVKVRYKQTLLGAAWAILQPLATTGVFAVLFGLLMGRGNEPSHPGIPYALSTFCAMLAWQLFASTLSQSATSLADNQQLITKVYCPRMVFPLAAMGSGLMDFMVGSVALAAMMVVFGFVPLLAILMLPILVLLVLITSLSLALWLSALNVLYRDFRYVIPFLIQFGMFVSPVLYDSASVTRGLSPAIRVVYGINPMVTVIESFRWALLGAPIPAPDAAATSFAAVLVLLASGAVFFKRMESTFADLA